MKSSIKAMGQVNESPIDERYRLLLLKDISRTSKKFQLLVGSVNGSSVVPSVLLWVAQNPRGMNAKEHCSGMPSRTPGSSSASVRAVLNAQMVERPLRSS